MRLENWAFVIDPQDGYSAPELIKYRFHGDVHDHPYCDDGTVVVTSPIVGFDPDTETFLTNSGSHYQLGDPHPDYEAAYPGSKVRLLIRARSLFSDRKANE